MTSTEMPDEIYADATQWYTKHVHMHPGVPLTAYIRSDKVDALLKALENISRMKTLPDHASNSFTLAMAHNLAQEAIEAFKSQENK